jgi:hypothetical protein
MESRVIREGITAGIIGALVIAVWFLGIDAVRGEMLATPVMLGTSVLSLFLGAGSPPSFAGAFLGYTAFHFIAFMIVGIMLSAIVNASERVPSFLFGFLLLVVAFEVGWLGWTSVLAQGEFGALSWLRVFIANLLASGAMGAYLWRQHPGLATRAGQELAGAHGEG